MLVDTSDRPIWGWNSYDGYGAAISEAEARENLALFHEKLQPSGYEYFCLDAAWYADGSAAEWAALRKQGRDRYMHIDEYGRYVPSPERFPSGLKDLADRCHALGLKFGVHMMRGFPRPAAEKNTPVKGTSYHVRDLLTPEQDYKVELYSAYTTSAYSNTYEIPLAGTDPSNYIWMAENSSDWHINPDLDPAAHYIVMSTCAYIFEDARSVLHGKLVPVMTAGGELIR